MSVKAHILNWKKYDGSTIENVSEYVQDWAAKWPKGEIMIGCDSQEHVDHVKYSVTINMHMIDQYGIGRGGHVIFANVIDKSKTLKTDMFTKLWMEAELSVQAAESLELNKSIKIIIHLDYNVKAEKYSHVLYNSGIGYVRGMGYEAYGKPHAWAATHSADALCKNKQAKGVK